ncbi:MAG: hypothetical protein ACTSQE_12445 [Candidatus Heimdallarchaeaceae archaeon]
MTFNPNIPAAADIPSQSQAQLLANFTALNTVFQVNHIAFNAATDAGKHLNATLLTYGAAPAVPVTLAGEGALFTRTQAAARMQLYYVRENAGAEIPISMLGGFAKFARVGGAIAGTSFNINTPIVVAGGGTTLSVAFTTPMLDTDYLVFAHKNVGESFTFQNITVNGFDLVTTDTAYTFVMIQVIGELA